MIWNEFNSNTLTFKSNRTIDPNHIATYKYATGFLSAVLIADKLLTDEKFVEKYKQFLSSGCSKDPISLLKIAECDLEDEKTFDNAFAVCRKYLKMFEEA